MALDLEALEPDPSDDPADGPELFLRWLPLHNRVEAREYLSLHEWAVLADLNTRLKALTAAALAWNEASGIEAEIDQFTHPERKPE